MAAQASMLHIRVDDETKAQATEVLATMGLFVSDEVRLLLHRVVVDQAFPLELKVPNAETRVAMAEADQMTRARRAQFATADELFADLKKSAASRRTSMPRAALVAATIASGLAANKTSGEKSMTHGLVVNFVSLDQITDDCDERI